VQHFNIEIKARTARQVEIRRWLQEQCAYFIKVFQIASEDILAESYSDLILNTPAKTWPE
jgi:hypothetical protein